MRYFHCISSVHILLFFMIKFWFAYILIENYSFHHCFIFKVMDIFTFLFLIFCLCVFFFLKKIFNIYLLLGGETEYKQGRGRERGRCRIQTDSRLQLSAQTDPDVGLEPTNCEIIIWATVGCLTNWGTQAPCFCVFFIWTWIYLLNF